MPRGNNQLAVGGKHRCPVQPRPLQATYVAVSDVRAPTRGAGAVQGYPVLGVAVYAE